MGKKKKREKKAGLSGRIEKIGDDGFGYCGPEGTWVSDKAIMLWREERTAAEEEKWGHAQNLFDLRERVARIPTEEAVRFDGVAEVLRGFKMNDKSRREANTLLQYRDGDVIVVQDFGRGRQYDADNGFMSAWIGGLTKGGGTFTVNAWYLRWFPPVGAVRVGRRKMGGLFLAYECKVENGQLWNVRVGCYAGEEYAEMFASERARRGLE